MAEISINAGKGFTFVGNKLSLNWESSDNISVQSDGIMIPDLTGTPGIDAGSKSDNWTTALSGTGIKINRSVVQCIFAMSCWHVTSRTLGSYAVDYNTMKTKADVITEINALIDSYDYTSYKMQSGDLFMFRSEPVPVEHNGWTKTCDDGKRYQWAPCLAMFSVDSITYLGATVTDITLTCLWHNSNKLPTLTNGSVLT